MNTTQPNEKEKEAHVRNVFVARCSLQMLLQFSNHKTKMPFEFTSIKPNYYRKHQGTFSQNLLLDVGICCLTTIFLCFYLQNKSH